MGLQKSRINPQIETDTDDEEYAAADVTDMPLEALACTNKSTTATVTNEVTNQPAATDEEAPPVTSSLDTAVEISDHPQAPTEEQSLTMSPLESAGVVIKQPLLVQPPEESSTASTFRQFIPIPKCQRSKQSTTAVAHASHHNITV